MTVDRGRLVRSVAAGAGMIAIAFASIALTPNAARADRRAYPIDLPGGTRLYLYTEGGSDFPTDHKLEIWQETNGLLTCSTTQGLPLGHYTPAEGDSGLQRVWITCEGRSWAPDTRLLPPAEPSTPPPPTPTTSPSPSATPSSDPSAQPTEPSAQPSEGITLAPPAPDATAAVKPELITIGHDAAQRVGSPTASRGFGTGFLLVATLAAGVGLERARQRTRAR